MTKLKHGAKGFAISVDALFATIITIAFIGLVGIGLQGGETTTIESVQINQAADDAITAIDNIGIIVESINNPYGKPTEWLEANIEEEFKDLLPKSIDFRMQVLQYQADIEACKITQDFISCFPDPHPKAAENPVTLFTIGRNLPENKEIFHGKRIILKNEPGNCTFEEELKEKPAIEKETGAEILFQGNEGSETVLWLQEEVVFEFVSSVERPPGTPVTQLNCDEEALVTLTVKRESTERTNVDMIFAVAKNTSMAECAIAAGRNSPPILDTGENIIRADFEQAFTFDVLAGDPPGALDAVLSWAACAVGCPEFRLKSPTGILYGEGQATTEQNSQECNEISSAVGDKAGQSVRAYYYNNRTTLRYLALGSALAETGTWEVWVKNTVPTDYSIEVKYIDNNHWVETTPAEILPWDEPISKVDIAKVLITEFADRADWKVDDSDPALRDKYAYAEVGFNYRNPTGKGTNIQPSAGLKDARDLGPPISSQLKNLDTDIDQIPLAYYSYGLLASGLVNEELTVEHSPEWDSHRKFAIIYGDSLGGQDPPNYTKELAVADALLPTKNITYYTIDFSEENWGKAPTDPCQNTELLYYAEQTGGTCFSASNEEMMAEILDYIALGIVGDASTDPGAINTTLTMTFPPPFETGFLYDFTEDDGVTPRLPDIWDGTTLEFQNITVTSSGWIVKFDMTIPCDFEDCDLFFEEGKAVSIPPEGTIISYDSGGPESQEWTGTDITDVQIFYDDLVPEFLGGHFYGTDRITIDYRILNAGYGSLDLSTINPDIKFYVGSSPALACSETELDQADFTDILDAAFGASAGPNISVESQQGLNDDGWLCLWIDPDDGLLECNANNKRVLFCSIPKTFGYIFEYWMWEK